MISFSCIKMCIFCDISKKCLARLTPFKQRLNCLNTKQRATDCLTFRITLFQPMTFSPKIFKDNCWTVHNLLFTNRYIFYYLNDL